MKYNLVCESEWSLPNNQSALRAYLVDNNIKFTETITPNTTRIKFTMYLNNIKMEKV